MRVVLLSLLVALCLAAVARASDCTGDYVASPDLNTLKRNQTAACAIEKLDYNKNGAIEENEYEQYKEDELWFYERAAAPEWNKLQDMCDCNLDGHITSDEMIRSLATCLETNFWVNRVYDYVC